MGRAASRRRWRSPKRWSEPSARRASRRSPARRSCWCAPPPRRCGSAGRCALPCAGWSGPIGSSASSPSTSAACPALPPRRSSRRPSTPKSRPLPESPGGGAGVVPQGTMAIALVTGANRGIGLALVRRFAARGDQVIAVCRHASAELRALKVQIEEGVDVTSEEALAARAGRLADTALDLLVLNAGILREDDFDSARLQEVRAQLEVDAVAPLAVVLALRKSLRRGTKIGAITSRMGSIA